MPQTARHFSWERACSQTAADKQLSTLHKRATVTQYFLAAGMSNEVKSNKGTSVPHLCRRRGIRPAYSNASSLCRQLANQPAISKVINHLTFLCSPLHALGIFQMCEPGHMQLVILLLLNTAFTCPYALLESLPPYPMKGRPLRRARNIPELI